MTKSKENVNLNEDISKYIHSSNNTGKQYVSVLLQSRMYENIKLLAENEGMGATTYIRERLIIPKLQEIVNELKTEYDKTSGEESEE